jgi:hypothetical protein
MELANDVSSPLLSPRCECVHGYRKWRRCRTNDLESLRLAETSFDVSTIQVPHLEYTDRRHPVPGTIFFTMRTIAFTADCTAQHMSGICMECLAH